MRRWLWIGGLSLVILLALLIWGVIAGIGLVTDRLPEWVAGGKQVAAESVQKADEILPGLRERSRNRAPHWHAKSISGRQTQPCPRRTWAARTSQASRAFPAWCESPSGSASKKEA